MGPARRWTLEAAKQILPDVRERTERAVRETESLTAERDRLAAGAPEREEIDERIGQVVQRWAREMEALGLDVTGGLRASVAQRPPEISGHYVEVEGEAPLPRRLPHRPVAAVHVLAEAKSGSDSHERVLHRWAGPSSEDRIGRGPG